MNEKVEVGDIVKVFKTDSAFCYSFCPCIIQVIMVEYSCNDEVVSFAGLLMDEARLEPYSKITDDLYFCKYFDQWERLE